MTNTEAKAIMENLIYVYRPLGDSLKAWETAIEALEKQTPKRTTYIHLNTRYTHWGRVRHDQFECCNCGLTKEFVDGHTSQYKFCPQCGLKIDWSDEDDK